MKSRQKILLSACALVALTAHAHAADKFWGNQFGGAFGTAANWQGNSVAGSGDIAHFGLTNGPLQANYTVTFAADTSNQILVVEDDLVTFDLNTRNYNTLGGAIGTVAGRGGRLTLTDGAWVLGFGNDVLLGNVAGATGGLTVSTGGQFTNVSPNAANRLMIGQLGNGTLIVENGGVVVTDQGLVGVGAGVTGTATVTGAGSRWANTTSFIVGTGGQGTVNVSAGGRLESAGGSISRGVVNVSGTNSIWVDPAGLQLRNGTLNITQGGRVDASASLGLDSGEIAAVTVADANSQWISTSANIIGQAGRGTLDITAGGLVRNGQGLVGIGSGSVGIVTVSGANSRWQNTSFTSVGSFGTGTLNIGAGGLVESAGGFLGDNPGGNGTANANGGSWINTGVLTVGRFSHGTLNITGGAVIQNTTGTLGAASTGTGIATVSGANSAWVNSLSLNVGEGGGGTLNINSGGRVTSAAGVLGSGATGIGNATVGGASSQWTMSGNLKVGAFGQGTLNVNSGGRVQNIDGVIAEGVASVGVVTVDGLNSLWGNSGGLVVGSSGHATLNVTGSGRVASTFGTIAVNGGNSTVNVSGADSQWLMESFLAIGDLGAGTLNITAGGNVVSREGLLGLASLGSGTARVDGVNSLWSMSETLKVGNAGKGTIEITNGGRVQNVGSTIGSGVSGSSGLVSGVGSRWTSGELIVAGIDGSLKINNGGLVESDAGSVGRGAGTSRGIVTVSGNGARWTIANDLVLGESGEGVLSIQPGGIVTVGGQTRVSFSPVSKGGSVNMLGGELDTRTLDVTGAFNFHAGTLRFTADATLHEALMDKVLGEAHAIVPLQHLAVVGTPTFETLVVLDGGTFSAGSMIPGSAFFFKSGTFNLTSDNLTIGAGGLLGDVLALSNGNVNVTNATTIQAGARLILQGGSFSSGVSLSNAGEIQLDSAISQISGGLLTNTGLLRGSGLVKNNVNNVGSISIIGDDMQFSGIVTNAASGVISGRGTLRFAGGLTNQGKMQFSGGPSDVYGNVSFTGGVGGGEMINSGSGNVVTFYGNVVHNGDEIRTSPTNTTVFFGNVSGAGPFTGPGAVRFEGTFSPGNSPAAVSFGGDVQFGTSAELRMEVVGPAASGQFDQLLISGGASLDGKLSLSRTGGFIPMPYTNFDIVIASSVSGLPDAIEGMDAGNGFAFASTFLPDRVRLTPALIGDLNLDRQVTISDFIDLASHFNGAGTWKDGDLNGDFRVTISDFIDLASHFNASFSGEAFAIDPADAAMLANFANAHGASAVPEPAMILMLMPAMLLGRRRRHL